MEPTCCGGESMGGGRGLHTDGDSPDFYWESQCLAEYSNASASAHGPRQGQIYTPTINTNTHSLPAPRRLHPPPIPPQLFSYAALCHLLSHSTIAPCTCTAQT